MAIRLACALACTITLAGAGSGVQAQAKGVPAQKLDADYTAKIKAATADPRILTELVDHMVANTICGTIDTTLHLKRSKCRVQRSTCFVQGARCRV